MAKVHPQTTLPSTCNFTSSSRQKTFTIWMKSLVLGGKGCTVYDSEGQLAYRVDNYNSICRDEVCLMDSNGTILFTIMKKKHTLFGCWEVFRSSDGDRKKREFEVTKLCRFLHGESCCKVSKGIEKNKPYPYKIENQSNKFACKIVNEFGHPVAEVKRKQSNNGVVLGQDVLTLVVEPCMDDSLVVAFLVTFALINHRI